MRELILMRMIFNNIQTTTIYEIAGMIQELLQLAPQLVQRAHEYNLPDLHQYKMVFKMYPQDFINFSMQHPDEFGQLTPTTAKEYTYDYNIKRALLPTDTHIWLDNDYKADLIEEINYILLLSKTSMTAYDIIQAVRYKFWLHAEALNNKGMPLLPSCHHFPDAAKHSRYLQARPRGPIAPAFAHIQLSNLGNSQ